MKLSYLMLALVASLLAICYTCSPGPQTAGVWPQGYIADTLPNHFRKMPISDNEPTKEGVALGRFLFYDPILSRDSTISCATCHRQEAAFSDGPKRFSEGTDDVRAKRNTLPLFNLAMMPKLFWDGKASSIEEQVFHPVSAHDEMNLDWDTAVERVRKEPFYADQFAAVFGPLAIDSQLIARAIAQFERTLLSYRSRFDRALQREIKLTEQELEGIRLMGEHAGGDCGHCHSGGPNSTFGSFEFRNNGLDDFQNPEQYKDRGRADITRLDSDIGKFKVPSLRNLAFTAPYMHDGRFNTLMEVLDFYSEGVHASYNVDSRMQFAKQGGVGLNQEEKEAIHAFLLTLTDSAFVADPRFARPVFPWD